MSVQYINLPSFIIRSHLEFIVFTDIQNIHKNEIWMISTSLCYATPVDNQWLDYCTHIPHPLSTIYPAVLLIAGIVTM